MLTNRGLAIVGAGGALLVLWWVLGDQELLLAAAFLLLAAATAVAYSMTRRQRLRIMRRLAPPRIHAGDTARVQLVVDNIGDSTARELRLVDMVEGLGTAEFELARLGRGERAEVRYRVLCRSRGVYRVGPATLTTSDPLHLTETPAPPGPVDRLVVFPRVEELTGFPTVRAGDPAMDIARPDRARGGGEDFYTLREYQTGDDLRRVHWPSSAKANELMIRQLETQWQARALIVLDVRSMAYPSPETFEKAVSGAASVVAHLVTSGFHADLWAGGPRPVDASRYEVAMERLALVDVDPSIDLMSATSLLRQKGGGGTLVLITGSPDDDLLNVHELLKREYPNTLLMTVTRAPNQTLGRFLRAGAVAVSTTPEDDWAEAWMSAMDSSWVTESL
ncbi:MAG: DUF58 domain-containing protein [Acidimicrobiia bacterium]